MKRAGSIGPSISAALLVAALWTPLLCSRLAIAADPTDITDPADGADGADGALYVSISEIEPTGDLAPGAEIVTAGQRLSIDEAVAMSIKSNLRIEVERYSPLIAAAENDGVWGDYDPQVSADFIYDVRKSPNTSVFNDVETNRDRTTGGGVGVTQQIPFLGASLNARYDASSVSTRARFQSLSDQFNSSFFVGAVVPLAQGLIWNSSWTSVKVGALDEASSVEGFRVALMDTVQETVNAYWSLVAARDRVRVAQKSLDTARALLGRTKTQYEVGVKSRVDVVEAEAGVADREFDVIRDANLYRGAQDRLIDQVMGRELSAMTTLQFAPSENTDSYVHYEVNVEDAVSRAFRLRPELAQAQQAIEANEFRLKFAKNQRLPVLDLEAGFGYVGVSGDINPRLSALGVGPLPVGLENRPFDQSDNNFFQGSGADNYSVGAKFSIPFPNTTARKKVVVSELDLRRAHTSLARAQQTIIIEVRTAARNLLSSIQGIEAAERRRLAAEEQLRAERIRLEHGESTPFEVLQRESDLVEAESQKISAMQTYRSAEVALDRAEGTILDNNNIVLSEAAKPTR